MKPERLQGRESSPFERNRFLPRDRFRTFKERDFIRCQGRSQSQAAGLFSTGKRIKARKKWSKKLLKIKRICSGRAIFLVNDRIEVAFSGRRGWQSISATTNMPVETARKLLGEDKNNRPLV